MIPSTNATVHASTAIRPANKIYTAFPESNRRTHESHQHKRFQASDVFGATTKMGSMPWKLTSISSFDEVSSFCDVLIVFSRCVCVFLSYHIFCGRAQPLWFESRCVQWHSCVPDLLHQSTYFVEERNHYDLNHAACNGIPVSLTFCTKARMCSFAASKWWVPQAEMAQNCCMAGKNHNEQQLRSCHMKNA